jgi:hypothetical protein
VVARVALCLEWPTMSSRLLCTLQKHTSQYTTATVLSSHKTGMHTVYSVETITFDGQPMPDNKFIVKERVSVANV